MEHKSDLQNRIFSTLINSIYQSIHISKVCNIGIRENESLSVDSFSKIQTSVSELSSATRLLDLLANVFIDKTDIFTVKKYFVIEEYFGAIVKKLNSMFSDKHNISFNFSSSLSKERTFYINEFEIERIILPIIYFISKFVPSKEQTEVKIAFRETTGIEQMYIVTVTAQGDKIPNEYTKIINAKEVPNLLFCNADSISAYVLRENVESLCGSITYLRSGKNNKITFAFPHINALDNWTVKEPSSYIPDDNTFMNLFYSLLD